MAQSVACVGDSFSGICSSCDGKTVTGTLDTGSFVTIDGKNICVTGSTGTGSCGHTCTVTGKSSVWLIDGFQVARVGDPVTGTIEGVIISGSDFVTSD